MTVKTVKTVKVLKQTEEKITLLWTACPLNGKKASDRRSWLIRILSNECSIVIPCHSTLHDIPYSFLKTMKIFKAELLMCNPARVRVATERGNQSFMFQRGSILKAGIYATAEVVFIF